MGRRSALLRTHPCQRNEPAQLVRHQQILTQRRRRSRGVTAPCRSESSAPSIVHKKARSRFATNSWTVMERHLQQFSGRAVTTAVAEASADCRCAVCVRGVRHDAATPSSGVLARSCPLLHLPTTPPAIVLESAPPARSTTTTFTSIQTNNYNAHNEAPSRPWAHECFSFSLSSAASK